MTREEQEEFFSLLSAFCADALRDETQRERFKTLLRADSRNRRAYVHYVQMHLHLRRALGGIPATAQPLTTVPIETTTRAPNVIALRKHDVLPREKQSHEDWRRLLILGGSLAAALVALVVLLRVATPYKEGPIATLTQARECIWEVPMLQGAELGTERLVLTAGVAQLTFRDGAVMLVEAPAEIEPVNARSAYLHSGRVVVRAPHGAENFVVNSPRARVLDLGTEFGVGVGRSGETLVQVFEGSVVADFEGARGDQQRLIAGDAVTLDGTDGSALKRVSFDGQRFIRRLPDPPAVKFIPDKWLVPYNKNRSASMTAIPAPQSLRIDGDLSDWDRSAPFESRCSEPYGENYNFTGFLMYDEKNVYVGGHVKDPAPLCSVIDPNSDPNVGWKGGSVQFRLSSDRKLGWPAKGELWRPRGKRPVEDLNSKIAHITMWYHKPTDKPCLYIQYGMDFHSEVTNPSGFQGAFRKDDDGLGYTFEYAIPWSILNADADAPRAGDTIAACWNVHWSDAGGRLWKGMLVDLLNPTETGTTYSRAATWGKLLLRP